jgi:hypothetical protein
MSRLLLLSLFGLNSRLFSFLLFLSKLFFRLLCSKESLLSLLLFFFEFGSGLFSFLAFLFCDGFESLDFIFISLSLHGFLESFFSGNLLLFLSFSFDSCYFCLFGFLSGLLLSNLFLSFSLCSFLGLFFGFKCFLFGNFL